MIEIERTYLVKKIPENLGRFKQEEIRQGYFSQNLNEPPPLRIRQKGPKMELTKKFRPTGDLAVAEELNIPLSPGEFERLWQLVIKSLEKTRYFVPLSKGLTAELDVFHGQLEGLSFVEVEFKSREEMSVFVPPSWFGRDVTDESFSSNSYLSGKSFDEIKPFLSASGIN